MTVEFLVGILMTAALGSLSFFLVRFIGKHDEFEKNTRNSFTKLSNKIVAHEAAVNLAVQKIEAALNEAGLDSQGKKRVDDLRLQVFSLRKTLKEDIIPMTSEITKNHGKVIIIEEELRSQEKKVRTLYEAVELLVKRQNPPPK